MALPISQRERPVRLDPSGKSLTDARTVAVVKLDHDHDRGLRHRTA